MATSQGDERNMSASAAFDPQTVELMQFAHDRTCQLLNISDKSDPMVEIIAKEIIRLASRGEREPQRMSRLVVKALGHPP
jgi:predicted outer membrane protein